MFAKEIMTTNIVAATADMPAQCVAQLLLEHRISALPVLGSKGEVIGMVSEGDLTGRRDMERVEQRDWWLALLAEGDMLAPEFLASIQTKGRTAHDIMSTPVITVKAFTNISEIAQLLMDYRIKRVPVVDMDNQIIGIVSRADLVRALAMSAAEFEKSHPRKYIEPFLAKTFASLDQHFHPDHPAKEGQGTKSAAVDTDANPTVKDFQSLVVNFEHEKILQKEELKHRLVEQHKKQIDVLINYHVDNKSWQTILHHARTAAQQGLKEYLILRFPHDLCSDGGRAINVNEDGWQETLRGEAAEIYLRWKQELRPQGFHLSARVLEYPGGFPGDIGLFLMWGQ